MKSHCHVSQRNVGISYAKLTTVVVDFLVSLGDLSCYKYGTYHCGTAGQSSDLIENETVRIDSMIDDSIRFG